MYAIYITGIPSEIPDIELTRLFNDYGHNSFYRLDGLTLVSYLNEIDAIRAIHGLNEQFPNGPVTASSIPPAQPKKAPPRSGRKPISPIIQRKDKETWNPPTSISFYGIPTNTTFGDAEELFKFYGPIESIQKQGDLYTVIYDNYFDSREAVKDLNGKSYHGSILTVQETQNPTKFQ